MGTRYSLIVKASVEVDPVGRILQETDYGSIRVVLGDYSEVLSGICQCLEEARKFAANSIQESIISKYIQSFANGDIDIYKESLKVWVKDFQSSVEYIFRFVEP